MIYFVDSNLKLLKETRVLRGMEVTHVTNNSLCQLCHFAVTYRVPIMYILCWFLDFLHFFIFYVMVLVLNLEL